MGSHQVNREMRGDEQRLFTRRLLNDVRALERMLQEGVIESGVRRIGVEQEVFLVDPAGRPAPCSEQVLARLDDPRFTTELARFNLECNLPPLPFGADCLRRMETALIERMLQLDGVARELGARVLLTGILPTLTQSDLGLENMASEPRYHLLNAAITRLRGRAYELNIKGTDDLTLTHDSVMPEACNTSFQVHFQVGPAEFAQLYNIAQATAGPVLAAATNSPLLFGKRLWRETRIAVFEQALETRATSHHERAARVSFGRQWVDSSVLEIFREDIARFRVVLGDEAEEDPFAKLDQGEIPELKALTLHNGTVYRWNRVCYGLTDGRAHLRIENRVFPSGPTVRDEVANAAFWFGLMAGLSDEHGDIREEMDFDDAKGNFLAAARHGLDAHLTWLGGEVIPARTLICDHLLPLARRALSSRGIDAEDIDRFLIVIEDRVRCGRPGSQWMLDSLAGMRGRGTRFERMSALTRGALERQWSDQPVHDWTRAELEQSEGWKQYYERVEQIMSTDLFSVHQDDLIDLAAALIDWQGVRYVLVEDDNDKLVGLVTPRVLLKIAGQDLAQHQGEPTAVSRVMRRDVLTVSPETPTLEAVRLMRDKGVGCLPVVVDGQPVGMITDRSFVHVVHQLLEKTLQDG